MSSTEVFTPDDGEQLRFLALLDDVFSDGQLDFGLDDEVRENDVNAVLDVAVVVNRLWFHEHVRILKVV